MSSLSKIAKTKKGIIIMKNKRKIFLVISISMLLLAIGFIWYALNHPEMSFPWNNNITYSIYLVYIVIMIICFLISKRKK
jgi:membrane-bound acyltransferase YfiQ involved in biofilm formation